MRKPVGGSFKGGKKPTEVFLQGQVSDNVLYRNFQLRNPAEGGSI